MDLSERFEIIRGPLLVDLFLAAFWILFVCYWTYRVLYKQ